MSNTSLYGMQQSSKERKAKHSYVAFMCAAQYHTRSPCTGLWPTAQTPCLCRQVPGGPARHQLLTSAVAGHFAQLQTRPSRAPAGSLHTALIVLCTIQTQLHKPGDQQHLCRPAAQCILVILRKVSDLVERPQRLVEWERVWVLHTARCQVESASGFVCMIQNYRRRRVAASKTQTRNGALRILW